MMTPFLSSILDRSGKNMSCHRGDTVPAWLGRLPSVADLLGFEFVAQSRRLIFAKDCPVVRFAHWFKA